MKNALIINFTTLCALVADHLNREGYKLEDGAEMDITAGRAFVVTGARKVDVSKSDEDSGKSHWVVPDNGGIGKGESQDSECYATREAKRQDEAAALRVAISDEINRVPLTAARLSSKMGVPLHNINAALQQLSQDGLVVEFKHVREDGSSKPAYLYTATEHYAELRKAEDERIAGLVAKWRPLVLHYAPKFYETALGRPEILEAIRERTTSDDSEEIYEECYNIFYALRDEGSLEHKSHMWKAALTDTNKQNLKMLMSAVYEAFEFDGHEAFSAEQIAEQLPGTVDLDMLRWALKHESLIHSF